MGGGKKMTTFPHLLIYATKKKSLRALDCSANWTQKGGGVVSRVSVQQVQPGRKRCLMPWVRG